MAEGVAFAAGVPTFGAASKAIEAVGNGITGQANEDDAEVS